ncbi:MAG: 30S ribosomal protein S4 [Patescibacteria group bacterium]|nr:30S ribosomal protein S4 [Patescibacteria group bacterium]
MRSIGPRCRTCRYIGEKLFLKGSKCTSDKCPLTQGSIAPGQIKTKHSKGKASEYKKQLIEQQKIRKSYDINVSTLRKYYEKALGKQGKTSNLMMQMLECRLDNVVYKAGFCAGRPHARQLTTHGHFCVNARRVDIPSYQVKVGDVITIREGSSKQKAFIDLKPESSVRWLKIDPKKREIIVSALPEAEDFSDNFNPQSVVEFYSR